MIATVTNIIGRNVHYTGDAANAPRDGYVSDVFADRWGTYAVIAFDDAGELGAPTTTIPVQLIDATPKPGGRFHFA